MPSYMNMNLYLAEMLLSYKIKENASVERAIFNSARFGYEIFINRIHEGGHQISVKLCTNKERRKVYLYLCIPKLLILSSTLNRKKGTAFWQTKEVPSLKFIYSEKATKFCEIFTLLLTTVHTL